MKFTLLIFAVAALANPIAEPAPSEELAVPFAEELLPRQIGTPCNVVGRGNLDVCLLSRRSTEANFIKRDPGRADSSVTVLLSACQVSAGEVGN
jgi:hypothetical protein